MRTAAKIREELPIRLIDSESERLVLGNILSRGVEFWRRVGPELEDTYFALEGHRRVFKLLRAIADAGQEPGLPACYLHLIEKEKTTEEFGLPWLSDLAYNNMIDIADPAPWIARLKRKATERQAWRLAERMRLDLESGADAQEELARLRGDLRSLEGELNSAAAVSTIVDAIAEIGIDNLLAPPRGVVASPWSQLTELINGGLRPGELWIVAARPSVGKTTAALQWALAAGATGQRVLFCSLEMPAADLLKRVFASQGAIHHSLLVRGDLDNPCRRRVAETLERIGDYKLAITDRFRTLRQIVARIAAAQPAYDLVVVDYLGLIDSGGHYENRNQEVSALSRAIKLAALEYSVPILCAHQLSRANETEKRRPQLSDLRDSGSLEQDADGVLMLDDPGSRKRGSDAPRNQVDVLIAKQRNGMRGAIVNLQMESAFCRMSAFSNSANVC
jgi:replicative DNA helicase